MDLNITIENFMQYVLSEENILEKGGEVKSDRKPKNETINALLNYSKSLKVVHSESLGLIKQVLN